MSSDDPVVLTPVAAPDEAAGATEDGLAAQVAAAVRAVDGVHDLEGGSLGEAVSRLPGHRVAGVRLTDDGCELHVAMYADADLIATAQAVREAIADLVPGAIDITVEDVVPRTSGAPGGTPPERSGDPGLAADGPPTRLLRAPEPA